MQQPRTIGPYQVVRELGRGGMGVVYEVLHPDIPRPLALKLVHGWSADELLRFRREGELLARVRHPSLLRVHQLAIAPEGSYLVTDLIEGRSPLASNDGRPFEPRRAAEVVRAIADGLAAAHALGIVHRDLKPDNVILQPDGTPVLIDFGMARAAESDRLTATGALVGTPAYMAPEQASGAKAEVDARTDVYGLGAVLFALLTGRAPFEGPTLTALLTRVLEEDASWPADADPQLAAIGRVAMRKEPGSRYPTALALRDDLDRYLRGAAPAAAARAGGQRASRPRALLLALALAGALLLALVGVALARRPASVGAAPAEGLAAHLAWEQAVVEPWCLGLADGVPGPSAEDLRVRRAAVEQLDTPEGRALRKRLRAYARLVPGGGPTGGPPGQDALELTAEALEARAQGALATCADRLRRALAKDPGFLPAQRLELELLAAATPEQILERSSAAAAHPGAVRFAVKAVHGRVLAASLVELEPAVARLERAVVRARELGADLAPFAREKRDQLRAALASDSAVALAVRAGDTRVLDLLLEAARSEPEIPIDDLVAAAASVFRDMAAAPKPDEGPVWVARAVSLGAWLRRASGRAIEGKERLLGEWCEGITLNLYQPPLDDPRTCTEVVLAYLHFGLLKPSHLVSGVARQAEAARLGRLWPDSAATTYLLVLVSSGAPRAAALDQLALLLRDGSGDLGVASKPRAHLTLAERLLGDAREIGSADREERLRRVVEHARRAWVAEQPALWFTSASSEAEALELLGRKEEGLARRVALVEALGLKPDFGLGHFETDHHVRSMVLWLEALNGLGRHDEVIAQHARIELELQGKREAELAAPLSVAYRASKRLEEARALLPLFERHAHESDAVAIEATRLCFDLGDLAGARTAIERIAVPTRRAALTATLEKLERRQQAR